MSGMTKLPGSASLLCLKIRAYNDDDAIEALKKSPNLTELDITASDVTGNTINAISHYNLKLKSLNINGCAIQVKGSNCLRISLHFYADLECLSQLKLDELKINYCWKTKVEEERKSNASHFLDILKKLPTLRSLWAE